MTTLAETRNGLAAVLGTIDGLRVYDYLPDDAHYPAALIRLRGSTATNDLGGSSRAVIFSIHVLIPASFDRKQLELYDYVERTGSKSIFAAVRADRKFGGLDVNANPDAGSFEETDLQRLGAVNVYGLTVNIPVFVSA
jgi:hypothetical protein